MVMVGESSSKGCKFESWHCILDGHFSHLFVVKIVMCVWKNKNKMKKRPGLAHLKIRLDIRYVMIYVIAPINKTKLPSLEAYLGVR